MTFKNLVTTSKFITLQKPYICKFNFEIKICYLHLDHISHKTKVPITFAVRYESSNYY